LTTPNATTSAGQLATQSPKSQAKDNQAIAPTANNEVSKPVAKIADDVKAGADNHEAKAQTTEEVLAGVVPRRDDTANSRVSEQKRHGKNAEDEMSQEIESRK
jgi:ribosomal protein S30